ncbi:MAG: ABC transporter ATP-binding protein [Betaproteobacteria bacterium]|nr:ABC transporter ATP-binding protein [Betaproteobacteria bacterium]MBU6513563.1 ABC transporter ATP-binding protein [Betaproteobacteria bacterium]MDE1956368.1 ABC transporter ATP-binding protein [Betaproteobacteria bacterium]MDE2151041.1 ABC transporter ATP-binding protein [Betaproteobacteria bacterium]MDE2477489.1 ABC transporter ATP-binding protein [Betaproteobacteria bacterium]
MRIEHLARRYEDLSAVDDVSIDIEQGEIFALLGASGCGKSTLLRMLAGFERPDRGRVLLAGRDITALAPYERPINMMFQSYALFPHLSVYDNIAFGPRRSGMDRRAVDQRVHEMLELVELQAYARRMPHQLSGGQQQRVALARSLAKRPQLLLLDEPLGALDRKLRERTQIELVSILRRVGVTCVVVTHDQEEAMTMADRIAVMREGRFVQVGEPLEIYENPKSRFVADFIGNVNLFAGELVTDEPERCEIRTPEALFHVGHGITGTLGMRLSVALRPEKMRLQAGHAPGAPNQLHARVAARAYLGSYTQYELELAGGRRIRVAQANADRHVEAFDGGAPVTVRWSETAAMVIQD